MNVTGDISELNLWRSVSKFFFYLYIVAKFILVLFLELLLLCLA